MTETVGPSVVKTQKGSDKFCATEWSKRKREREREEAGQSLGRDHYNWDHQPCVNFMNIVNTVRETLLLIDL